MRPESAQLPHLELSTKNVEVARVGHNLLQPGRKGADPLESFSEFACVDDEADHVPTPIFRSELSVLM